MGGRGRRARGADRKAPRGGLPRMRKCTTNAHEEAQHRHLVFEVLVGRDCRVVELQLLDVAGTGATPFPAPLRAATRALRRLLVLDARRSTRPTISREPPAESQRWPRGLLPARSSLGA